MEGHLTMSQKERHRFVYLDRVVKRELRQSELPDLLGVSLRQCQRLLAVYRAQGEAGLVHGLRGKPGSRRADPELKSAVLSAYRAKYPDFGPTLASEKLLERDGLVVHPETLRLWLVESGDWTVRKRRVHHRSRRKRRACLGELIQLDGSPHDWFEGRGSKCCLITLVDDATGLTSLPFAEDEGTFAVMAAVRAWIERYGIPLALYTDRLKTYLTDREPTTEEQLAGQEPLSQFGRACSSLGIRILAARSPQAKGRVERKHGLTQDRLVKELRLAGIDNIADANEFLEGWLPSINDRFRVVPADAADAHRPVPDGLDLRSVFCRHEQRTVGNDWVVRYNNRSLQIVKQPDLPPSGSTVTIRHFADGNLEIWTKQRRLRHTLLGGRPERVRAVKAAMPSRPHTPPLEHPWRGGPRPAQDTNPRRDLVEQMAEHSLGDGLPGSVSSCMRNVTFGGER